MVVNHVGNALVAPAGRWCTMPAAAQKIWCTRWQRGVGASLWTDRSSVGCDVDRHDYLTVQCADLANGQDIDMPPPPADGDTTHHARRPVPGAEPGDDRRA